MRRHPHFIPQPSISSNITDTKFQITLSSATAADTQQAVAIVSQHTREEVKSDISKTPLNVADITQLLSRVTPIAVDEKTDELHFHQREKSLAAPKTGDIVDIPFPPEEKERAQAPDLDEKALAALSREESGPLAITRYTPVGEQHDAVTIVSITFNQAMIQISSVDDVKEQHAALPITITPTPSSPAFWRWHGTNTVIYTPQHRLNYATNYTVTIGAGIKSVTGSILEKEHSFTFSTRKPQVIGTHPYNGAIIDHLNPTCCLMFNQRIDIKTIMQHLTISSPNVARHDVVTMDVAAVRDLPTKDLDPIRHWVTDKSLDQQWLVFRFTSVLTRDTTCTISFDTIPSAEGPLMGDTYTTSFSTYQPLRITSHYPNLEEYSKGPPGQNWQIYFNNVLDHATVRKEMFRINPPVDGVGVQHDPDTTYVTIYNNSAPDTIYTVDITDGLHDIYGQPLEKDSRSVAIAVGAAVEEQLYGSLSGAENMIVMDPAVSAAPYYPLMVYNYSSLRFRVWRVNPSQWPIIQEDILRGWNERKVERLSSPVHDVELKTNVIKNEPMPMSIDLSAHLQDGDNGVGQLLVMVEPTEIAWNECQGKHGQSYQYHDVKVAYIQCTKLAIDIFTSQKSSENTCTCWVTELSTGKPIVGAKVQSIGSNSTATTNEHGLAILPLSQSQNIITATYGSDITFLPDIWNHTHSYDQYIWHIFNDRGLYKPKETVSIKGYVRKLISQGEARIPTYQTGDISYQVYDPRGSKFYESKTTLNSFGAFDIKIELPDNINLGDCNISFQHPNTSWNHTFKVQEFRRPEYEVRSSHTPTTTHYTNPNTSEYVIATVNANYFAGGPLTQADVIWTVTPKTTTYTPPGWSEYTFGTHRNRWWWHHEEETSLGTYTTQDQTGSDGKHELKVSWIGVDDEPKPINVTALAAVRDLNNQTLETSTTWLIHPCRYYVGLRLKETYGHKNKPMNIDIIVVDVDGKVVEGVNVDLRIYGSGKEKAEDAQGLTIWRDIEDASQHTLTSTSQPLSHTFTPTLGGNYTIGVEVSDTYGGRYHSKYDHVYVGGGYEPRQTAKVETIPQEEVKLLPNKTEYNPGDTAEIMIISPFSGEGLLLLQCDGLVGTPQRFTIAPDTTSTTVSFIISQDWIPGLYVMVEMIGSVARVDDTESKEEKQPPRPAIARGEVELKISRQSRSLDVNIISHREGEEVAPGKTIHIKVNVKNSVSKAAPTTPTEVTLVVVDESVLSLTGHTLSSPLEIFYPQRGKGSSEHFYRPYVLLINAADVARLRREMAERQSQKSRRVKMGMPMAKGFAMAEESVMMMAAAPMMMARSMPMEGDAMMMMDEGGGMPEGGAESGAIAVRSNFDTLAKFANGVLDSNGNVEFEVKLPDSLTRYRIWAMVANTMEYGLGESLLTVQLPLMIRPSPPRFLNYGDYAYISVVLQNQTDRSLPVTVAIRATNATVGNPAGYKLILDAAKRTSVTFPVQSEMPGTARFQFVVSAPGFSDAAEVKFPVYTPSTSEAFATYGDIAEKTVVFQPIKAPSNVIPQFGGLDISTSSTQLQSLTDALLYLITYPYECCEQLASRLIGIASLWSVLKAFQVKEMPTETELRTKLDADINTIRGRQKEDGGFGWWAAGHSEPYITIHVTLALVQLQSKDLTSVPSQVLDRALAYCKDIRTHVSNHPYSKYWSEKTKFALYAFAYYVASLKEDQASNAATLFNEAGIEKLSMESLGFVLISLHAQKERCDKAVKQILTHLHNHVTETADTAHFITSYGDDGASVMLHSNRRTDAILLNALLKYEPTSTLVPKLAKGLLAHRVRGRWSTTQENCFILLALREYFDVYEKDEPNFNVHTWLGEHYAGEQIFKGRSVDTNKISIPMTTVLSAPQQNLILQKQGPGRLYYRLGLNYAPNDLNLKAVNYGFKITRTYTGVDSPSHVTQTGPNAYRFKLGEKVKVTIEMTTPMRRYHVALVDWMPAGIEALNPALKGTLTGDTDSSVTGSDGYNPWKCRSFNRFSWPEHENLRDERAEAFRSLLWEGVYEWSYIARATTSGTFVAPPAKAEEMYAPENFGRSATDRIVIE